MRYARHCCDSALTGRVRRHYKAGTHPSGVPKTLRMTMIDYVDGASDRNS